jgi:DNA polymerase sigma
VASDDFYFYACEIHEVTDLRSQEDKIEKNIQTMLHSNRILQHQYCARNYQTYSDHINDLLQVEKNDELTMRNHHQHIVGSSPLQRFTIA